MKMKKVIQVVGTGMLLACFAGCGQSSPATTVETALRTEEDVKEETEPVAEETAETELSEEVTEGIDETAATQRLPFRAEDFSYQLLGKDVLDWDINELIDMIVADRPPEDYDLWIFDSINTGFSPIYRTYRDEVELGVEYDEPGNEITSYDMVTIEDAQYSITLANGGVGFYEFGIEDIEGRLYRPADEDVPEPISYFEKSDIIGKNFREYVNQYYPELYEEMESKISFEDGENGVLNEVTFPLEGIQCKGSGGRYERGDFYSMSFVMESDIEGASKIQLNFLIDASTEKISQISLYVYNVYANKLTSFRDVFS